MASKKPLLTKSLKPNPDTDLRLPKAENTPRGKPADNRKKLRFLQLWHKAVAQKRLRGPGVLPWSVKGRGEGLRERGNHRIESVGFPSPLIFAAFLKARFFLLF